MYKVFMNDKPIILTDSSEGINNYQVFNFDEISFETLQNMMLENEINGVLLLSKSLLSDWEVFESNFKVIKAAGGKVKNAKNEILFIFRFDKWDLPKGHIEKGEKKEVAAIREVEEECGVKGLKILKELDTTYHVFSYKNELVLKVTYWFLMYTDFNRALTPQLEEDISEVVFKDESSIEKALRNTYENIKLLF